MRYQFLLACLILFFGFARSTAQPLPELRLGPGYEPSITTNRQPAPPAGQGGWVVSRMKGIGSSAVITRNYSTDDGANWFPTFAGNPDGSPVFSAASYDPTMAANPHTGGFLYGWQVSADAALLQSKASTWDVSQALQLNPDEVASNPDCLYDRPFVASAAASANAYMSWACTTTTPNTKMVRRGAFDDPFHWVSDPVTLYTAAPGVTAVPGAPIAVGATAVHNDYVYVLVCQHVVGDAGNLNNQLKLFRSTNSGSSWDSSTTLASYTVGPTTAGYGANQAPMTDYWVCTNPAGNDVYVFYAKIMLSVPTEDDPSYKYENLYCRRSGNNGETWGAPVLIQTGWGLLPSLFAPHATDQFFRVGRVAACVDAYGQVHVAWFDNHNGRYASTNSDYWTVMRAKSADAGQHWTVTQVSNPTEDSIGGRGTPRTFVAPYLPPGDYLSCDANGQRLIVAWPDTRLINGNTTQVYVRPFLLP